MNKFLFLTVLLDTKSKRSSDGTGSSTDRADIDVMGAKQIRENLVERATLIFIDVSLIRNRATLRVRDCHRRRNSVISREYRD